jgi:hypothetical protein
MATNNSINLSASGLVAYDGAGTFYGRTLTQPAAGITVSNADGTAGNPTLALANDLAAVEGLGTTGVVSRTGSDTWSTSTITQYAVHVGDASQGLAALALGTSGHALVSNGAGANPSFQAVTASEAIAEVTGTTQTAAVNTIYIANNAASITFTLPTTIAVGEFVEIVGLGAGGWDVDYTTNQLIHFGNVDTTTTTGTLASTNRYDCIKLRCVVANLEFDVVSVQGNITYT